MSPEPDGTDARPCPVCGEEMGEMDLGEVIADYCSDHGIWLDDGEYEVLIRRAGKSGRKGRIRTMRRAQTAGFAIGYQQGAGRTGLTGTELRRWLMDRRRSRRAEALDQGTSVPEDVPGPKPCPVCGETMETELWKDHWKKTPDVTVDVCEDHGLWLDRGELDVLVERAAQDSRRSTRSAAHRSYIRGLDEGRSKGRRRS